MDSKLCDWSATIPPSVCAWVLCVFMCTLIYFKVILLYKIKQSKEQVSFHLLYYMALYISSCQRQTMLICHGTSPCGDWKNAIFSPVPLLSPFVVLNNDLMIWYFSYEPLLLQLLSWYCRLHQQHAHGHCILAVCTCTARRHGQQRWSINENWRIAFRRKGVGPTQKYKLAFSLKILYITNLILL